MKKIIYLIFLMTLDLCATDHKSTVEIWKEVANDYNVTCKHPKPISKAKQRLVNEANALFSDTKTIISRLTLKPYIVEASAINASIATAKKGLYIPPKYRDDLARVGFMKNKPLIATAKKFLKFMKDTHKGEIIHVKNPKSYKDLCDAFCGKEGLYIMRTEDGVGYKLTGFLLPWDGKHVLGKQNYIKYATDVWLFVD